MKYLDTEEIQELTWNIQQGEPLIPKPYEGLPDWLERGLAHNEAIRCFEMGEGKTTIGILRKVIAEAFILGYKVGKKEKRSKLKVVK